MKKNEIQIHKPARVRVVFVDFVSSCDSEDIANCLGIDVVKVSKTLIDESVFLHKGWHVSLINGGPLAYAVKMQKE